MLDRWLERRRMQAKCPHEWHILREEKKDVSKWYESRFRWRKHYDIYCPECDKTRLKVPAAIVEREEEKRRIRRLYESDRQEFEKGDVITCKN